MSEFNHIPVLKNEVISALNIKNDGIYADGTAGGGNHSYEIGKNLSKDGLLICVDRDTEAIFACQKKISPLECKKEVYHTTFSSIPEILSEKGIKLDGLLLDLGVSSRQLDTPERGFSYMNEAVLDMRMDKNQPYTAADLLKNSSEDELVRIFFEYGEERYSRSVAKKIIETRKTEKIESTLQLVEIIKSAMPKKALREAQHPAKRIFQALRIAVNDELTQISDILQKIFLSMNDGGRIAIITFHSLEDRIVKSAFNMAQKPCVCPPDFPVCVCGKTPLGVIITKKPITATDDEIEINPRSRSAKLRVFERKY